MYVLNQGSTENDMISDVFLLYLLDRKRGAAKDYLKEAKTEGVMDPLQDGDLSSLHSQLLNLGYFGHNEKQFKSEEKTKLVRQDAKILKAEPNVNFKDFPFPFLFPSSLNYSTPSQL